MADTEKANLPKLRASPPIRERLIHFWSAKLPAWLDPWAPPLGSAMADGAWTGVWPYVSAYIPLVAFGIGFVAPLLRSLMTYVFTESLLFLLVGVGLSLLSG